MVVSAKGERLFPVSISADISTIWDIRKNGATDKWIFTLRLKKEGIPFLLIASTDLHSLIKDLKGIDVDDNLTNCIKSFDDPFIDNEDAKESTAVLIANTIPFW